MFKRQEAEKIAEYIFDSGCRICRPGCYDLSIDELTKGLIDVEYFTELDESFDGGF